MSNDSAKLTHTEQLQRMAELIIGRSALARAVIVLTHDLVGLAPALQEANIKVVDIPAGIPEARVKQAYLSHRILVTSDPKEFVEEAPIHEYGIVSLEKLTFIDTEPTFARNQTARLISRGLSDNCLWIRGAKFLLELRDDGNHILTPLE